MKQGYRLPALLFGVLVLAAGCSALHDPIKGESASEFEHSLTALSVPLDLRDYHVVNAAGRRGVFLKLSRIPDAVEDHGESGPPRIVIDIKGPTGTETPEEEFPGQDTLVSRVHVARHFGVLRVVLDLQGDDMPPYTVHQMADWVMIRIGP